jgi:hypothetical protein
VSVWRGGATHPPPTNQGNGPECGARHVVIRKVFARWKGEELPIFVVQGKLEWQSGIGVDYKGADDAETVVARLRRWGIACNRW